MKQYLDLLRDVRNNGVRQSNRTGIDCFTLPGAMLKFDMADGFPAVTTKKLAFGQVKGELIGFLKGFTSAAQFREVGCNIWDQNANENEAWLSSFWRAGEDDLGRIYGAQWREWHGIMESVRTDSEGRVSVHFTYVDQIASALAAIRLTPNSRRIIVTAWNPAELDQAALPPCHLLFQLIPHTSTGKLHMVMYQRSCDLFLGVPFNIASYAVLLHLFSAWTGYEPGTLTMMLADCHIYENHLDQVAEQLDRKPLDLPRLALHLIQDGYNDLPLNKLLEHLKPNQINLRDYVSHPPITAPMAV